MFNWRKQLAWFFGAAGLIPPLVYLGVAAIQATRWPGANLAWEGFLILPAWLGWWVPASGLLSVGMAGVEGIAFAYAFGTWRDTRKKSERQILMGLIISTATMFLIALTLYGMSTVMNPYTMGADGVLTRLTDARMKDLLLQMGGGGLWVVGVWSFALNASTILAGGLVGYSESLRKRLFNNEWNKANPTRPPAKGA